MTKCFPRQLACKMLPVDCENNETMKSLLERTVVFLFPFHVLGGVITMWKIEPISARNLGIGPGG